MNRNMKWSLLGSLRATSLSSAETSGKKIDQAIEKAGEKLSAEIDLLEAKLEDARADI